MEHIETSIFGIAYMGQMAWLNLDFMHRCGLSTLYLRHRAKGKNLIWIKFLMITRWGERGREEHPLPYVNKFPELGKEFFCYLRVLAYGEWRLVVGIIHALQEIDRQLVIHKYGE